MTEAGKGAEEVQDILLKNVAMFQKVCDRIQFEGVSRSEFAMLHMIHNKKDERGKLTLSELAAFLEVSSPAVSRMIKTLEDKNTLSRAQVKKTGEFRMSRFRRKGRHCTKCVRSGCEESETVRWRRWVVKT